MKKITKVVIFALIPLGVVIAGLFVLVSLSSDEAEAVRQAKKVVKVNLDSNIETDYTLKWVRADVVVKEDPYYVVYLAVDVKQPNLKKYRPTAFVGVKFTGNGQCLVSQPSLCNENPGAEEIRRFRERNR